MIIRRAAAFAAFLTAAACATPPGGTTASTAPERAPPETAVVLQALSSPSLPSGECGMILWTLDDTRPAPVFRYVAGKKGTVSVRGVVVDLVRLEAGGSMAFGVAERQVFEGPEGLRITVDARFGLGFDGGTYLERGLITVESSEGWRAVSPTAGIAGCRS